MSRTIIHCDLNNFYASVECVKNPDLKGIPMAVGGRVEERRGIILAKSPEAKATGIKTGETINEARRKCPNLLVVPPDFSAYSDYSKRVREIYKRYTDLVEPFGPDECWLDVTGSSMLFGSGEKIAVEIMSAVERETGLTVSSGVSFNKVFAKLGSDMKLKNAPAVISEESFKEKIWNLPADRMLFVGKKTYSLLLKYGIETIGDLAQSSPDFLRKVLGKNGVELWQYANGLDNSPVTHINYHRIPKSVSRGTTCAKNLFSTEQVSPVLSELCAKVSAELREEKLSAKKIKVAVKDDLLNTRQFTATLNLPTFSAGELFKASKELFTKSYNWARPVRALTVGTFDFISEENGVQLTFGSDLNSHIKNEKIDDAVAGVKKRYGENAVFSAGSLLDVKII